MALDLAEIVRRFGPDYLQRFGARMLPSHRRVLYDIPRCRTEAMGGQRWHCPDCDNDVYVFFGCRNRSCPSCHARQTREWLEARQAEILPCEHFHVTVTVPQGLREVFRKNQKEAYGLLMQVAAEAVTTLCKDKRHLGGTPGILSVLHTWTNAMDYHPHVHMLVTAGGVAADNKTWIPSKPGFFVPARALSRRVRGQMKERIAKDHPEWLARVPGKTWTGEWVANILPWGGGRDGVLKYLARYVFRIALTNARLISMDATHVTFRAKDRKRNRWRTVRVTGAEFLRRFLQHVLPKGFHKVRYFGLWHPSKRAVASRVRLGLLLAAGAKAPPTATPVTAGVGEGAVADAVESAPAEATEAGMGFTRCPHCGATGGMVYVERVGRVRPRQGSP